MVNVICVAEKLRNRELLNLYQSFLGKENHSFLAVASNEGVLEKMLKHKETPDIVIFGSHVPIPEIKRAMIYLTKHHYHVPVFVCGKNREAELSPDYANIKYSPSLAKALISKNFRELLK